MLEAQPLPQTTAQIEQGWWQQGYRVAGIDEAGRGAWAGPVMVAAVILPAATTYAFKDSKVLTAAQRHTLELDIKATALAWAVCVASSSDVDNLGVLAATHQAAYQALACLQPACDVIITDYLKLRTTQPLVAPAKADRDSFSVAAASILAKTARDRYMQQLHQQHPQYGFASHKGYGTKVHQAALEGYGICPEHRTTFAPIAALNTPITLF